MNIKNVKNFAFTLAEVLITIGVIAVVAAITISPIIHKCKIKQLEVAFKKSSSNFQIATHNLALEFGLNKFDDFNFTNMSSTDKTNYQKQIQSAFLKQFVIVKATSNLPNVKAKDYSGNYNKTYWGQYCLYRVYILKDGSAMCDMQFEVHDVAHFIFDTNGPYKGPNRYGYDIFLFRTNYSGGCYPACTRNLSNIIQSGDYNMRGCYYHALMNRNPDDKTKGYWNSL